MTQFQLEKTKRENAEALVSQLQAELHTVRLESERSSLRISELQGTLEAAQMMSKQNVVWIRSSAQTLLQTTPSVC